MPNSHESHDALCLRMLAFVAAYRRRRGFAPTLAEVGAALGTTSKGHLCYTRDTLRERGWLTYSEHTARTMRVTSDGRDVLKEAKASVHDG